MAKGKLIVLEGIDGSGKSAQYRRLCARFDEMGMAYHHIVFPRYDQESSALIRMYLNGAFGAHPSDVNAYAASTFFAVDRYASYRTDWGEICENGGLILSDRYTTSNAIHQGPKLPEAELPEEYGELKVGGDMLDHYLTKENYHRLVACVLELDDTYRTVFEYKFMYQMSDAEIADVMGISAKNVNIRYFRARKKLQEMIRKEVQGA